MAVKSRKALDSEFVATFKLAEIEELFVYVLLQEELIKDESPAILAEFQVVEYVNFVNALYSAARTVEAQLLNPTNARVVRAALDHLHELLVEMVRLYDETFDVYYAKNRFRVV